MERRLLLAYAARHQRRDKADSAGQFFYRHQDMFQRMAMFK